MLSVEVYTAQQQFSINIFNSKLTVSGQGKFNLSNQSSASIKISIEHDRDGILDDQVSLHSPVQCCSPNVDGELVITSNQPFKWFCSSHLTSCGELQVPHTMIRKHYQECLLAKRIIMRDDCTFHVNCIAVQEGLST